MLGRVQEVGVQSSPISDMFILSHSTRHAQFENLNAILSYKSVDFVFECVQIRCAGRIEVQMHHHIC